MSTKKVYWYVLFCKTGEEENISKKLKEWLDEKYCLPFIPQKTCIFRRQGRKTRFSKICFPGYVFIESKKSTNDFISCMFPVVYNLKDAYRFLSYSDKSDIAMREEEITAFSKVFGKDYCIDISAGFREGDSVKIVSGPLIGFESKILKINKNKNEAVITTSVFGTTIPISVGLEIIEKSTNS